jgi:CTP synthase
LFCNVREEAVIPAEDVSTIYAVPIRYHEGGLDAEVCRHFGLRPPPPELGKWHEIVSRVTRPEGEVTIAVVGKYTGLVDAYKSLVEALTHGGVANNVRVRIAWVDAATFDDGARLDGLADADGILIPGGFGERGTQGKIEAARFARQHRVPYFGICFGMQMAVVEAARNLAGIPGAGSTEFGPCAAPVVGLMTEWIRGNARERRTADGNLGGTMRLGAYACVLKKDSRAHAIFGADCIHERHRHRYEVNNNYIGTLERCGLVFSGMSPDGLLPEIVEIPDHPWFIGVQFHPELRSRPFDPHPLFHSFIRAAIEQSRLV